MHYEWGASNCAKSESPCPAEKKMKRPTFYKVIKSGLKWLKSQDSSGSRG